MTPLEQTLAEIVHILGSQRVSYMVIGGIANLVWGTPRATLDIDITISIEPQRLPALIEVLSHSLQILPLDPQRFIEETSVLPLLSRSGIRIDLIIARLAYEQSAIKRSRQQVMAGTAVQVCTPEDLIIHKIVSERPKDREDIIGIIKQQTTRLDRQYLEVSVKTLADGLSRPNLMDWLQTQLSHTA